MKSWHLIIDIARCHDCNDCFLADKDEFVGNDFAGYSAAQPWEGQRWMNIKRRERGQYPLAMTAYLPMPCMHCENAPCVTADGAVYRREDGLVIIDPERAKGRKDIATSCPYGAIYWNTELELAQKCTGCAHLMDEGWTETRCSHVCPTGAISLVVDEDDEVARRVAEEGLERYRDELGTRPRVYYKNLHRWNKVFVAASIACADTDECAAGALATVTHNAVQVGEAVADIFGDARIDELIPGREYVFAVSLKGYETVTVPLTLDQSQTLPTVFLQKT